MPPTLSRWAGAQMNWPALYIIFDGSNLLQQLRVVVCCAEGFIVHRRGFSRAQRLFLVPPSATTNLSLGRSLFGTKTLPHLHSSLFSPLLIMLQLQFLHVFTTTQLITNFNFLFAISPHLEQITPAQQQQSDDHMIRELAEFGSLVISNQRAKSMWNARGTCWNQRMVCWHLLFLLLNLSERCQHLVIITFFPHVEKSWVLPVSPEIWSDDQLGGWKVGNSSRD